MTTTNKRENNGGCGDGVEEDEEEEGAETACLLLYYNFIKRNNPRGNSRYYCRPLLLCSYRVAQAGRGRTRTAKKDAKETATTRIKQKMRNIPVILSSILSSMYTQTAMLSRSAPRLAVLILISHSSYFPSSVGCCATNSHPFCFRLMNFKFAPFRRYRRRVCFAQQHI